MQKGQEITAALLKQKVEEFLSTQSDLVAVLGDFKSKIDHYDCAMPGFTNWCSGGWFSALSHKVGDRGSVFFLDCILKK